MNTESTRANQEITACCADPVLLLKFLRERHKIHNKKI